MPKRTAVVISKAVMLIKFKMRKRDPSPKIFTKVQVLLLLYYIYGLVRARPTPKLRKINIFMRSEPKPYLLAPDDVIIPCTSWNIPFITPHFSINRNIVRSRPVSRYHGVCLTLMDIMFNKRMKCCIVCMHVQSWCGAHGKTGSTFFSLALFCKLDNTSIMYLLLIWISNTLLL